MGVQSFILAGTILQAENDCGLNKGRWKEMGGYVGYLDIKESSVGFENWLVGYKRFRILGYKITAQFWAIEQRMSHSLSWGALKDKPLEEEIMAVVWIC